jgi:rhodanese-related sulfurtransferase
MDTFPEISHSELLEAMERDAVTIIDCNGTDSFRTGHIPNAIDFESEAGVLADLLPHNTSALVVVYCGGLQCSAWLQGARAAQTLGYTNVCHYAAGISGWKDAHAEVEHSPTY